MQAFIDLPWRIYEGDANWVPPVKSEQARLLDPRRHPFWEFAERELFLATRGKEVVGRIASIVDSNYNRYHNEKSGAWGFFESTNEPEVAMCLFSAAERWAREKGMHRVRGPLNPSTNYEVGLLVKGFDRRPAIMMTYNPRYYPELVSLCGFKKEKDLVAYLFTKEYAPPKWAFEIAERLVRKGHVTIRTAERSNLESELRLINDIYRECWGGNWGFVPMTEDEIKVTARSVLPIVDTDFVFFVNYNGEPAGVGLILPDVAPLLKRLDGKLGLSALIKKRLYWSEVTGLRGLLLGVKEEYRQAGVPLVVFDHVMRLLKQKGRYEYLELGWNLEDNEAINEMYETDGGMMPCKRYRVYVKECGVCEAGSVRGG